MKGHEYVREAVRTHLETYVPLRLAAHLTANGLSSPTASDVTFLLADGLQDIDTFPVVVVRSTDASDDVQTFNGAWWMTYELEVIVACDHRVHGDSEGASKDRDRLLLAVRECVYAASGLTDDIDISPAKRPEQTGAAAETRAGVPLAAGTIRFVARVVEELLPLTAVEDIDAIDQTVTAFDASQDLP